MDPTKTEMTRDMIGRLRDDAKWHLDESYDTIAMDINDILSLLDLADLGLKWKEEEAALNMELGPPDAPPPSPQGGKE